MAFIYISNDNLLSVDALKNQATGIHVNSATVTATLKTPTGVNVSGQTWPLTLDYVASSNGKFIGILEESLSLIENQVYTAEIIVNAGSDHFAKWELELTAAKRTK